MNTADLAQKVRHLDVVTNRKVTEVFAGHYRYSFKGQGIEVSDLREYQEGDDVRHIDWVTTAKQGKPYIRQYEETHERRLMVLLDTSSRMHFTSTGPLKNEVALEAAAITLFSALKNGDRFGAILFDEEVHTYIPPRKGRRHLLRIVRDMIAASEAGTYKASNPNAALTALNAYTKKHALCFLLSDDVPKSCEVQMRIANRKHEFIVVQVQDPLDVGELPDASIRMTDPLSGSTVDIDCRDKRLRARYAEQCNIQQERIRTMLQRQHIDHIRIQTDASVYKELLSFFKRRQHRQ